MTIIRAPASWQGRIVPTLEVLLFIRQQGAVGVPIEMFVGSASVQKVEAFVAAVAIHVTLCGAQDAGFAEFMEWLRKRGEWPAAGWGDQFLRRANGDHRAAIDDFLNRCEEFAQANPSLFPHN
jgi:hypothetical protein